MKKSKKGFTLIELLVVIAIIGLLATLSVVALNSARVKSRDARRLSDVKQIQTGLELYFNAKDGYPTASAITLGGASYDFLCEDTGFVASACTDGKQLLAVPAFPQPADGCAAGNQYVYTSAASSTYALTYCKGNTGYTATPSGIGQ